MVCVSVPVAAAVGTQAATVAAATAASSAFATIGTVASIASAGVGALGALNAGKAAAASASYNAQVAAMNANIARQNADEEGRAANSQVQTQQMKNRSEMGALKANQGASGVDLNSGSSLDVQTGAKETGQLNALSIRLEAARKAYGYSTQAASFDGQSNLDKSEAANDESAGEANAATTLIGGVGNAAARYSDFQSKQGGL